MLNLKKRQKYAHLMFSHYFILIAVETLGLFKKEARSFLKEFGQCRRASSGNPLAHLYLFQRISVAVQRGNAAAGLECARLRDES